MLFSVHFSFTQDSFGVLLGSLILPFVVDYHPSSLNFLLSFLCASTLSGLMLTSGGAIILSCLDEKRFNSYSIKHFIAANIIFVIAIISMCLTIGICRFKFESTLEYIAIVIEFFTVQAIFPYLVLRYSLFQTWWTSLTGSLATLVGYDISFDLLGELISSATSKTIIGLIIFSTICTFSYLIAKWDMIID